ncbi:putative reverse transcriptase domain-containing protein, partial [Tanacetum coccineum]
NVVETEGDNGNGNGGETVMDRGTETEEETRTKIEEETGIEMEEEMGTEGAVGLEIWFEKMKSIFHISNSTPRCQMVPEEEDKVERYIWGLPKSIQGIVTSFAPKRLHDDVRMASSLMDQRDCKTPDAATDQRDPLENQKTTVTCYECGREGHYKSECPKLRN